MLLPAPLWPTKAAILPPLIFKFIFFTVISFEVSYLKKIFSKFTLLSGDRYFGDDKSVIAGFGLINDKSVLVIGQEKGEDLNSRIERNFGMMRPEGYRKCIRLMKLADRFKIPVVTFIDTPGAYPGLGAEQRGQDKSQLPHRFGEL